jgi:rare lipoprotein A
MKTSRLRSSFGLGAALLLAILALSYCARTRIIPPAGASQSGIASWYGADFHGRRTSNSEVYNMYDLTAAHKTLPFGTKVLVTNLTNSQTVCVRINDRGPFIPGRVIDLSFAAARLIDMVGPGTAPVRLDILADQSEGLKPVRYAVQVGAYAYEDNARSLEAELRRRYASVQVKAVETGSRTYFRVRIPAKDRPTSEALARRLSQDGYRVLICEYD